MALIIIINLMGFNKMIKKLIDKSFFVNSKDLFNLKKNPKLRLSVKSILQNDKIKKHFL